LLHKPLYHRIFELYTTEPIDFVDTYHVALMESRELSELYSYDRHFNRIEGVVRIEP
jgi:predicted nucleic acid-binding protein